MNTRRSSFEYEDLLACGRGELFDGGPQLPLPPMLMFDRISEIAEAGGEYGKGMVRAVLDLRPDLWFFPCHFKGDPVMPGCLGIDALWQMLGFFLGWLGSPGKGRALGIGEIKFSGQVLPNVKEVIYGIEIKRVMRYKLVLGVADGWLKADGSIIYRAMAHEMTGIIMGSGGPSTRAIVESADVARAKGPRRVGPFAVPKAMSSTASATLATWFKIKGVNYSISSACATSNHCIGNAMETIQIGKQDVIFAGGCEELDWSLSVLFDAMGAMSSKYNATPATASRPYDISRDGFVIAGGAGVVVLEELEHAKARGARIYGEVVGYGATSDGYDMVAPSGEGAERCMRMAMETVKTPIDYINPHATSTPAGDPPEIEAIRKVFGTGDKCPPISATKALTGHSLGATGVQEAIYSLLMMNNGFICESAHITELDPAFADMPIVRKRIDNARLGTVLSNSFGF